MCRIGREETDTILARLEILTKQLDGPFLEALLVLLVLKKVIVTDMVSSRKNSLKESTYQRNEG